MFIFIIILIIIFWNEITRFYCYLKYFKHKKHHVQENYTNLLIHKTHNPSFHKTIPNIIWQTYHNKFKIPKDIYTNIQKYAPNYKHMILNDNDAKIFMLNYFNPIVCKTFNSLKLGPHKADLLRYCLLYIYGGIYLDIKTELIKPIDEIFTNKNCLYVFLSKYSKIYQGIIATPPRNSFFLSLIYFIVNNPNPLHYHLYCLDFYYTILTDIGRSISPGYYSSKNVEYYFFIEKCTKKITNSTDKLDRYGICCYGYDHNKKIIKIRRANYPFK